MAFQSKNLGLVKAIHVGTTAPSNTQLIWYNDNVGEKQHYVYNAVTSAWETLAKVVNSINDNSDVDITGITNGQFLTWDGTNLVPSDPVTVGGGLTPKGTWNATTNTPSLADGVGDVGDYYRVSADGSTSLDGITDWKIGDHLFFGDDSKWYKVDNTDAVATVNGQTGTVVLTTTDLAEGTNKYYTETRVAANAAVVLNTAKVSAAGSVGTHSDVNLPGAKINGRGLIWSDSTFKFEMAEFPKTETLNELTDVDTTTTALADGDGLVYDGTEFFNKPIWVKNTFSALTISSGNVNWNVSEGYNRTLDINTNVALYMNSFASGDEGTIVVTQDGTGGHEIAFPAAFKSTRGTAQADMIDTDANAVTILEFKYEGTDIYFTEYHSNLSSGGVAWQPYTVLTYGATTTIDTSVSVNGKVTLTGDTAIAITGATDGMQGELIVIQDSTGGFNITSLPSPSKVIESTPVSNLLTTGADDITILSWRFAGTTYFWDYGKNFG